MWIFEIPGLSQFLRFMASPSFFNNLNIIDLVVGVILYFLVDPPKYFPSGWTFFYMKDQYKKHFKTLPARLGVFLMHSPSFLIFTYNIFFFPNGNPYSLPAITFMVMSFYRAFIYPFFRTKYASKIPIRTILLYAIINANIAINSSISIIFTPSSFGPTGRIVITVLFSICAIITIIHDWIICRQRKPDIKKENTTKKSIAGTNKPKIQSINIGGYTLDHVNTFFFKSVTCPQYEFTFYMWCVWSFFIGSVSQALASLFLLAYLTISRADGVHGVMCAICRPYAFMGRKPIFPFMTDSKVFYRILSRF